MSRSGGVAALVAAATFVVGLVLFGTMLSDYTTGDPTPAESVEFLVDNQAVLRLWYIPAEPVWSALDSVQNGLGGGVPVGGRPPPLNVGLC